MDKVVNRPKDGCLWVGCKPESGAATIAARAVAATAAALASLAAV